MNQYFTVSISVFLQRKSSIKSVFSIGKDRFVRKIQVFSQKTRFSSRKEQFHLKQYFTVETSVFLQKIFQKIRFFTGRKDCFVRKIQVLTTKTWFSSRKVYFNLNQYYTVETSIFLEKIFYKIRFFHWKSPFCQKNTSFNNENVVFKQKRVL